MRCDAMRCDAMRCDAMLAIRDDVFQSQLDHCDDFIHSGDVSFSAPGCPLPEVATGFADSEAIPEITQHFFLSMDCGGLEFALFEFGETGHVLLGKNFLAVKEHLPGADQITKAAVCQLGRLCDAYVFASLFHLSDDMEAIMDNGGPGH